MHDTPEPSNTDYAQLAALGAMPDSEVQRLVNRNRRLTQENASLKARIELMGVHVRLASGDTNLAHEAERAGVSIDEMKRRLYGEA